jgi:hypothetical protein
MSENEPCKIVVSRRDEDEKPEMTLEELYKSGNNQIKEIKQYFRLICKRCGSEKISIITENTEASGYDQSHICGDAKTVIKCCECGQAVIELKGY